MSDQERYEPQTDSYLEELDGAPRRSRCQASARLCKPVVRIKPSGRRLFHAEDCPSHPGQPIYANEYVGSSWRRPTPWRGR